MRSIRIFTLVLVAAAAIASTALAGDKKEFVIHEWGTFSTFSGSDGAYLKFYPDDRGLPPFVYNRHRDVKGGLPDAFVSLETPVMYFYSDRERTVNVQADFPKGMMTDWYPQASRPPVTGLRWDNIRITPASQSKLIHDGSDSRYYAARETDAAIIEMTHQSKKERERFLFYRGVADFQMPFRVQAHGKGEYTIRNTGKGEIPGFFLIRVEGKKVYFKAGGHLSPSSEVRMQESASESNADKLGEAVAALLVEQGLYEKEAKAMVKTWSADWFGQDGTRVLYIVPDMLTTEFLPLKIEPKPDKIVRVLVGRHDILTPEKERVVESLVRRLNSASNAEAEEAGRALNVLGRYRWAAQTAATTRLKAAGELRGRR